MNSLRIPLEMLTRKQQNTIDGIKVKLTLISLGLRPGVLHFVLKNKSKPYNICIKGKELNTFLTYIYHLSKKLIQEFWHIFPA